MKTEQETFDFVVAHLKQQNRQSSKDGKCAYRGVDRLTCAVGCLIPDEMYKYGMEGKSLIGVNAGYAVPGELREYTALLFDLQNVHDSDAYATDRFEGIEDALKCAAREYGLEWKP